MKKILFLTVLLLSSNACFAKNMPVESLNPVTVQTDIFDYNARIIKDTTFSSGFTLPEGAIVNMEIVKIVPARWGKRPAYMVVRPVYMEVPLTEEDINPPYFEKNEIYRELVYEAPYYDDYDWDELPEKEPKTTKLVLIEDENLIGRSTSIKFTNKEDIKQNLKQNWKKDVKKLGIAAGMKTVNTMVPGSGQIIQISKGFIMPEEGKTRLQSAANNVLDELPTKHLKKGAEINIKEGDIITLRMKVKGEPSNKHIERLNNLI